MFVIFSPVFISNLYTSFATVGLSSLTHAPNIDVYRCLSFITFLFKIEKNEFINFCYFNNVLVNKNDKTATILHIIISSFTVKNVKQTISSKTVTELYLR